MCDLNIKPKIKRLFNTIKSFFKINDKELYYNSSLFIAGIFAISVLLNLIYSAFMYIRIPYEDPILKNTLIYLILVGFLISYLILLVFLSKSAILFKSIPLIVLTAGLYAYLNYTSLWLKIPIAIIVLLVFALYPLNLLKINSSSNLLVLFTIVMILFTFYAGILIIDSLYGYKPISFYLNLNGSSSNRAIFNATINCSASSEEIYVGSYVNCIMDKNITLENANITFTSILGEKNTSDLRNLTFTAPKDTTSIYIEMNGLTQDNHSYYLSTSVPYKIYTYEEQKTRNENYLTSLMIILGIILFSIPAMMVNFKKLSE